MLKLVALTLALPVFAADQSSPFGLVVSVPGVALTLPNGQGLRPVFRPDPAHYIAEARGALYCVELAPSGWPLATDFGLVRLMVVRRAGVLGRAGAPRCG